MSEEVETPRIEHRDLRSAIEFAVAIAHAGQRLKPPIAFPAELKPYLTARRIPSSALGSLRRAIEADDDFRRRLGAGAVPELIDDVGREWLQRQDGWHERIADLLAAQAAAAREADAAGALRREEKRRAAAEQATVRTRAELVGLHTQLADLRVQLDDAARARDERDAAGAEHRQALGEARTAARHAADRAKAATARLAEAEQTLAAVRAERDAIAGQRDALLAERAERAGLDVSAHDLAGLRAAAESARRLADQLGAVVAAPVTAPRRAIALPGGTTRDSARATEILLRSGGLILVDGYNVSMSAWPDAPLAAQRERLLDLADDVARRFGSEIAVIFDGADVVGAHGARRLVRVRYSPAGVIADDVIRAEVAEVPTSRAVVVVTSDGAIRRDVAAVGGNVIASPAFLAVARR